MTDTRCSLCGGNAGTLINGAHAICTATATHGRPTPSLGDRCGDCNGVGCKPRSAVGPTDPNEAMLELWAPSCVRCNGTGVEPGTAQSTLMVRHLTEKAAKTERRRRAAAEYTTRRRTR